MSNPNGDHGTATVLVRGELIAPAGRRRLWVLIVRRCPYCSGSHLHRVGATHGVYTRQSGCAPRKRYMVMVSHSLRAVSAA